MKISVSELKGEREWRSTTELGSKKFYELLEVRKNESFLTSKIEPVKS